MNDLRTTDALERAVLEDALRVMERLGSGETWLAVQWRAAYATLRTAIELDSNERDAKLTNG